MKNNRTLLVFLLISAFLLTVFIVLSTLFRKADMEVRRINGIDKEIADLPFIQKKAEQLRRTHEQLSCISGSLLSGVEFATQLPRTAARFGIHDISLENLGSQKEKRYEILEIKLVIISGFNQVLAFLADLERGATPVQVKILLMKEENGRIRTTLTLRLFRQLPEVKE